MSEKEAGTPIDDATLEQVAGGYIHPVAGRFEVVDEEGEFLDVFANYTEAEEFASNMDVSSDTIDADDLRQLRRGNR